MNDRKLLELAAKAANEPFVRFRDEDGAWQEPEAMWNPLADDGDALRLAVKLKLLIDLEYNKGVGVGSASFEEVWEDKSQDPCAATRRAIVRAAAEIGKGMEGKTDDA